MQSQFDGALSSLSCPLFINVERHNYVVLSNDDISLD